MDLFAKCREIDDRVRDARRAGAYPYYRTLRSPQEPVVERDGRSLVMLGSNNYLGLASHPEVVGAAREALARYGSGTAGSRLLNGSLDLHAAFERRLARFARREAALCFATGFQANLGVLSSLLGRRDVAVLDALDHASLIDGARLGFARTLKFRHNDPEDLARKLARVGDDRGVLVVVDGVFSMEGDLAPLPEISRVARRFGARLLVDDAHGLGVLGASGRGTAEHFGVEDQVDLLMGTFSKALATVGGFVAGDAPVIEHVRHRARTAIFSAASPPASVAAASKALDLVEREPERRKRLWENTHFMKHELAGLGFDTGDSESPVVPLVVGSDEAVFVATTRLEEEGVFVNPVVSPAVPADRALIRTSYMATHRREHLERALEALRVVGREVGAIRG